MSSSYHDWWILAPLKEVTEENTPCILCLSNQEGYLVQYTRWRKERVYLWRLTISEIWNGIYKYYILHEWWLNMNSFCYKSSLSWMYSSTMFSTYTKTDQELYLLKSKEWNRKEFTSNYGIWYTFWSRYFCASFWELEGKTFSLPHWKIHLSERRMDFYSCESQKIYETYWECSTIYVSITYPEESKYWTIK